ncbi:hypothetical protein K1X84_10070 [bacterium]|nr:hypothetical protein [bacterium]
MFDYKNGSLDFFYCEQGRVKKLTNGNLQYEYYITDHLGNTRVTFFDGGLGEIVRLEESHYYAFGMRIEGLGTQSDNKFLFNGKELTDDFGLNWYEYGWRTYDAQLGRWHQVDPMDEFHSPYCYLGNNPMNFIDPDGSSTDDPDPVWDPSSGSFLGPEIVIYGEMPSKWETFTWFNGLDAWQRQTAMQNESLRKRMHEIFKEYTGTVASIVSPYLAVGVAVYETTTDGPSVSTLTAAIPFIGKPAKLASNVLKFPSLPAVQKFFTKAGHGIELGLKGNWNPAQAAATRSAINQFINSPSVITIQGVYRGNPVIHYVNPSTGMNIMSDQVGNFVGGWRLEADQLKSILTSGRLW